MPRRILSLPARARRLSVNLGLLGLAAVLVPYPFAGNHQKYNADVLADTGAAVIIEQKDLTKSSLKEAVTRMLILKFFKRRHLKENTRVVSNGRGLAVGLGGGRIIIYSFITTLRCAIILELWANIII